MYVSRKTEKERFSGFGDTQHLAVNTIYYKTLEWVSNLRVCCETSTKPWRRILVYFGRRGTIFFSRRRVFYGVSQRWSYLLD